MTDQIQTVYAALATMTLGIEGLLLRKEKIHSIIALYISELMDMAYEEKK